MPIHPRTRSNYRKEKDPFERTEFGLQFLDDRRGEERHFFETFIFKYVYFDTVMKVGREEVGKYQDATLPVLRMGGVQKFPN